MLLDAKVIEGAYVHDILEQPEALRRTLAALEVLPGLKRIAKEISVGQYRRIVLTGMGSSLFGLYPLHLDLSARGYPSLLVETAELIHYLEPVLGERTLVIAVSQSGESAEIVRLTALVNGRCKMIGVCNYDDSRLAKCADALVLLQAGAESAVSCKTYVSTLMALRWLSAVLMGDPVGPACDLLQDAAPAVSRYLADWRRHVADISLLLEPIRQIFVTGRGPSLATAQTGGLILKEATRSAAEGMSCAAFRHGPFELLSRKVLVAIMAGDSRSEPLNRRLAADVRDSGGIVAVIAPDAMGPWKVPNVSEAVRTIVEILPVQMLSLALAARNGEEAGRFALAKKITNIE